MLPALNFEPLPAGKENRKGNELFSPHQVVEGFSERFFHRLGIPYFTAFRIRFGFGGLKKRCVVRYWRDLQLHCIHPPFVLDYLPGLDGMESLLIRP
jgi:hypothetical protein